MTSETDQYRRAAKRLKKAHAAGEPEALARAAAVLPPERLAPLRHADALHVIAREEGAESWPRLKLRLELRAATPDQRLRRLRDALENGFHWAVREVLAVEPGLARADLGIAAALYDLEHLEAVLAADPSAARREVEGAEPLVHLAFSRHVKGGGDPAAMMACARLLLAHGADVDASKPEPGGSEHRLSAVYGAIGHGDNMELGRWLLEQGANPDDNESLYHATELGHHEGLRMLLEHGANPHGTNALLRALDFDDAEAVAMLLAAGVEINAPVAAHPSGEAMGMDIALHHAARRMCGAATIRALIAAGADPQGPGERSAYAVARIYGNRAAATALEEAGLSHPLDGVDALLARAAEGDLAEGATVDVDSIKGPTRGLMVDLVHLAAPLEHFRSLVAIGWPWDRPDGMGVPPVQAAGWAGLPDHMRFFLALGPNLAQKNAYGGDLLGTTLHGAANAPGREQRDHAACVRLALEAGLPLYRGYLVFTGNEDIAGMLADYAEAHPERVVDNL